MHGLPIVCRSCKTLRIAALNAFWSLAWCEVFWFVFFPYCKVFCFFFCLPPSVWILCFFFCLPPSVWSFWVFLSSSVSNCRVYKQCTGSLLCFQFFQSRLTKIWLIVENIFGQTRPSPVKQWNILWTETTVNRFSLSAKCDGVFQKCESVYCVRLSYVQLPTNLTTDSGFTMISRRRSGR